MDSKIKKIEVKENKIVNAADEKRKKLVEDAINVIEKFFDGRKTSFNVVFIQTREDMDKIHSSYLGRDVKTQDWVVGSVYGDKNVYIIDVDVLDKITCYQEEDFLPFLVHEITHMFMKNLFDFHLPMWLGEGIAYVVADQIKNQRPHPDEDLRNSHTEEEWHKTNPYVSAGLFIKFLINKFGKYRMLKLFQELDLMESREGFTNKFKKIFQADFNEELSKFTKETRSY